MISAIFFDLYGTLAGFQPSRFEIQSRACADFGIEVTPEGILAGYAQADAFMARQNANRHLRELDMDERNSFFAEYERLVLQGTGVDVDPGKALKIWHRVRQLPYDFARFDDVIPAMNLLRLQGLGLGVISNMDRDGAELLESMGLAPYLDFAVTSKEVGATKPHPPIFLAALEKAGAAPDETMHVGDQLTSDVEGAMAVGINPVLVDRDGNHRDFTDCPRIETLMELPELVAGY
jgi:putative hydrolase of the HAD superfamily